MYKNGGVSQIKPATKQPEWSTKSLKYYGETETKKRLLQRPKCPTWHDAWIWNRRFEIWGFSSRWTKSWTRSGTEDLIFHPVIQSCKNSPKQIKSPSHRVTNQISSFGSHALLRWHGTFSLSPVTESVQPGWWDGQSESMFSRGQRVDK